MPGWLQKRFIGPFSHLYGRTYIQLRHENLNNIFTAALHHHSHQNLRNMSLLYYSYLARGSLVIDLWVIWNLTLRLFCQLLIIHYTRDKCCNNVIYVRLSQTLQEGSWLLTAQPFRFTHFSCLQNVKSNKTFGLRKVNSLQERPQYSPPVT